MMEKNPKNTEEIHKTEHKQIQYLEFKHSPLSAR